MLFSDLLKSVPVTHVTGDLPDSFEGVYAGDLLSRAMSHVAADNLWITIMNNMNVIAVASLTEAAAVILAEGVTLMPDAAEAAEQKGICLLSSDESVYTLCCRIGALCTETV
ncbi:MAG: hypothetical protein J6S41_00355 [Clostridia bacterium]|nr:hypothetical protein [Clostridia bacterium]